jgi:hypothetical protein
MSFFFFYKIGQQEDRTGLVKWVGTSGRGEEGGERVKEGEYGAKTVYTCV